MAEKEMTTWDEILEEYGKEDKKWAERIKRHENDEAAISYKNFIMTAGRVIRDVITENPEYKKDSYFDFGSTLMGELAGELFPVGDFADEVADD